MANTAHLPLFPLGSALVPGLVMPLYLFEPRYRRLAADLQSGEFADQHFGIVGIRAGREVGEGGASALFEIGTVAEVTALSANDDGTYQMQVVGGRRFSIIDLDDSRPYLQAHVEYLDEPDGDDADQQAAAVRPLFTTYRDAIGLQVDASRLDPRLLSYVITAAMVLHPDQKQELLAAPDTTARLRLASRRLTSELQIIRALACLPAIELVNVATSAN